MTISKPGRRECSITLVVVCGSILNRFGDVQVPGATSAKTAIIGTSRLRGYSGKQHFPTGRHIRSRSGGHRERSERQRTVHTKRHRRRDNRAVDLAFPRTRP